jgi:thymidylate kinase
MIVIIEGIDRVGKTTLANKLCKELGFKKFSMKNLFPFDNMPHNVEINNAIVEMLKLCEDKVDLVFDRFHMTELVYGLIDRKYDGTKAYGYINGILESLNNTVLVAVKPKDIARSSKEHGKDLSKHEEMFEFLFEKYAGNKMLTSYDTLDETVKIVKFLKEK